MTELTTDPVYIWELQPTGSIENWVRNKLCRRQNFWRRAYFVVYLYKYAPLQVCLLVKNYLRKFELRLLWSIWWVTSYKAKKCRKKHKNLILSYFYHELKSRFPHTEKSQQSQFGIPKISIKGQLLRKNDRERAYDKPHILNVTNIE